MSKKRREKKRLERLKARSEKRGKQAKGTTRKGKNIGRNNPFAPQIDPEDKILFEDERTADYRGVWGDEEDDEVYDEEGLDEEGTDEEETTEEWIYPPPPPIKTISDESPEISEEENALVDAWWETYKKLFKAHNGPDEVRAHLDTFLNEHPDLVENLELQHEVLFELGARYVRQGRHADAINLLTRMRREFPSTYIKSFGYYDEDMISYLIITGRKDKIPEFLNYFTEYPSHDPDNLFKVLDLLMAHNCQDIVIPFATEIYHEVCTSPKIVGGHEILEPVILGHFIPFLHQDVSDKEMDSLAQQLRGLKVPLNPNYYKPAFLKERIHKILGEFTGWNIDDCQTNRAIFDRYYHISLNFMGFLHREKGKDWTAADFFRNRVYQYLVYVIPEGKRPKEAFVFTKNKIDRTLSKLCQSLFSPDPARVFGSLSALYYFADYLLLTQSITQERAEQIQQWCSELFQSVLPGLEKEYFSAKAFEQFPL